MANANETNHFALAITYAKNYKLIFTPALAYKCKLSGNKFKDC